MIRVRARGIHAPVCGLLPMLHVQYLPVGGAYEHKNSRMLGLTFRLVTSCV
jgi:hypothetical protein